VKLVFAAKKEEKGGNFERANLEPEAVFLVVCDPSVNEL
jgi:hypothetical protein